MGGWTERRKIGGVSEVSLMGRMSAKSMVMVHHRKRRRRRKNEKDAAKEQKSLEEIRVEQANPFLFGKGSLGPCTGGKAGPYDP